jgi:hypothetical protein
MDATGKQQANGSVENAPALPKPKAGRPRGSRNRRTVLGQEFLNPLKTRAKQRLRKILEKDDDDELALRAAQIVLNYCFGKPTERRLLGSEDGEPLEYIKRVIIGGDPTPNGHADPSPQAGDPHPAPQRPGG